MRRAVRTGQLIGLLALIACGDTEAHSSALRCSTTAPCPEALVCYRAFCIEGDELPGDLDDAGLHHSEAAVPADGGHADSAAPAMTGVSSPASKPGEVDAARPAAPPVTTIPAMAVVDAGVPPARGDAGTTKPTTPAPPSTEELVMCLGACTVGNLLGGWLDPEACQRCLERARCNPSRRDDDDDDDENARRCRNER